MKAVVLGASGGMGYALTKELELRKIDVVAAARNEEKLKRLFSDTPTAAIDAFNIEQLLEATKDATHIFYTMNLPYSEWYTKLFPLMENVITAAKQHSAKLIVVDNIYSYGKQVNFPVSEQAIKQPHTNKGRIRLQLSQLIHSSGIPYIIAHFPDFYGPHAENTLLHYTFEKMVRQQKAYFVGDKNIAREYIYTPDGAKALINLALHEDSYNQYFNIPGAGTITGEEICLLAARFSKYEGKVGTVGDIMMFFAGLINRDLKEARELSYLWKEPLVLSGEKYETLLGPLPKTPYEEGINKTIASLQKV